MNKMNRRSFIKDSMLGASCAILTTPTLLQAASQINVAVGQHKKIITRRLGATGIVLPVVSMGVMRADNPALVRAALDAGIIHLDTAYGYQRGKNETMLGQVLEDHPRDSFVIATKLPADETKQFLANLEISLQRLQMKYVDILYLHGATSRDDVLSPETLDALKTAKTAGKARHVGVSTHKNEPEVIRAAIDSGICEVVLSAINFKQDHYQVLRKAIAEAAEAGIGIIGMKTMAGGYHDRARTRPINCRAALKWVLQDENVTSTIPGITSFDHLTENVSVNEDLRLTEQEKADLALGESEGGLYCQGCERCLRQCKKGLAIPEIMRAYMYTYGYGDAPLAQDLLTRLRIEENPCADCVTCPVTCAKGFPIAERVTDIARITKVPVEFLA